MALIKKRQTKEKVKTKMKGTYSPVAPPENIGEDHKLTPEEVEQRQEERRKACFCANKLRINALIGQHCQLTDLDVALGDMPVIGKIEPPTVAYVKTMDGRLRFFCKDALYSEEEVIAFNKGYEMGAERAISTMMGHVGDEALLKYAQACRHVIHALIQEHKDRISFMDEITPGELANRIAFYFDECYKRKRSYTVPGLAYEIGFMCRQDMLDYISDKRDTLLGYMLARALMVIEDQRNTEIISGGGVMAGHKLDLATNFSWMDAGKKGEGSAGPQIVNNSTTINNTQNNINPGSLPPTLTLDQWQAQFLSNEKKKDGGGQAAIEAAVVDVTPKAEEPKRGRGRPKKVAQEK